MSLSVGEEVGVLVGVVVGVVLVESEAAAKP